MEAKDYSIIHCKDGNLYINNSKWTEFRSKDSKCFSKEDLEEIEKWIEQNNKYIRKDAFIEKACSWLENNLQGIVGGSIYMEDFRKYMEGE